jgi:DNA-directed RNA polymerase subunit beta
MNKLFVNNIGDLAEAQRASFYRFLSSGISEELLNFPNPFIAKIRTNGRKKLPCLVYLYPTEVKLKGPNFSIDNCLKRDMTYSIQIYIRGEYSYSIDNRNTISLIDQKNLKTKNIRIQQDIFFGEIPLMTEEGTFLISGCERVIISQIIRSPGVYFRKEFTNSRKTIYTATVISNKGIWTKFILDQKDPPKTKKVDSKQKLGQN